MSRQKEIFTKKTHESIENKIKKIYLLERFSYVNEQLEKDKMTEQTFAKFL